jgi:hypothetical protein
MNQEPMNPLRPKTLSFSGTIGLLFSLFIFSGCAQRYVRGAERSGGPRVNHQHANAHRPGVTAKRRSPFRRATDPRQGSAHRSLERNAPAIKKKFNQEPMNPLRPKTLSFSGTSGLLLSSFIFFFCSAASPTPFDVSKVDTSTISEAEMQRTIAHRNALQEQLKSGLTNQAGSLHDAAGTAATTAKELDKYQAKVDALAIAAAKDHDAVLAQKAAILRRDIIIGVLSLAIGIFVFVKFFTPLGRFI